MSKLALVMIAVAGIATAQTSLAADAAAPSYLTELQAKDSRTSIQYFYEDCTATDSQREALCSGYITAMWDHMWLLGGDKSTRAVLGICTATPVTYGAAKQAFKNWAEKHPERWGIDRMYGVMWALQESWPCK